METNNMYFSDERQLIREIYPFALVKDDNKYFIARKNDQGVYVKVRDGFTELNKAEKVFNKIIV